ncbi:MAG: YggS family pyridoxal phosphate-dependent enzyme [Deltaproteobacteria bacterium]|nr:YggS family pyridoxal phosphate-dependent enzyme [Deltaproteobacteria bacterium]
MSLAVALRDVERRVAAAVRAAGRPADGVTLVVVSKTQPFEQVVAAYDLGVRDFGENTVQELAAKAAALSASGRQARWHFVGRLQKNKVNKLLPFVHLVHTVDSVDVARALSQRAGERGLDVLIQVNIGVEAQKGGVLPAAVLALADEVGTLARLRLCGLMAIPPAALDPEPMFVRMAELSRALTARAPQATSLSMGMSGDFEAAIRCGATHIRVGTAIFGERSERPRG